MNGSEDHELDAEGLEEQDAGVWLSIGDLMSGLLMLFALLFVTVQVQLQAEIQRAKKLETELQKYKQAIDELPIRIINAVEGKVGGTGLFTVDPETGDVSLGEQILFDEGSTELKPEGKKFLQQFIPVYSQVIFSDDLFDRQIIRVIVEGHTSSKGPEKDNMELSLRRSLSVSDYIFSNQINFPTKEQFKQKLLSAGRGEIDADSSFDNPRDRKVIFRFQFRPVDIQDFLDKEKNNNSSEGKK
ncbi:OmpA family protein [Crocosphaera sp. XPORK-15E]|uniref:OmpA family protein n=1 Tax=Crocosphaera sp. XPORK-15E TaxID=3110247 RepID=UPI002B20B385|nr:OmpA family protein [Crocosphaera sp. XPORK-15E]MEA5535982.1 OmpA family protein [Crocosphaera sp. XPORK-15E]